ncbi:MAG TPA: hypothetical protein VI547_16240, partial [Anaerolineales bacterium]|nr:hypothetical protein [Anaerolineales bacterium]
MIKNVGKQDDQRLFYKLTWKIMVTIHFSRPIRFTGMIFTIAALLLANCATPGASEFEHPPLKVAWSL